MISFRITLGLTSFLLASAAFAGSPALAASCESLAGLKLPNTKITMVQSEAAGAFTPPGSPAGTKPIPVAFCRVAGSIKPTSDSDIRFEVWLPQTAWTGRYESVGNGGMAGSIVFNAMVSPLIAGSAVAGTDDGHEAPVNTQAEWALGHPEKVIDYAQESAWREDARRIDNGSQVSRVAHLALHRGPSVDFSGYWQRHVKAV